jgi:MFS family permease
VTRAGSADGPLSLFTEKEFARLWAIGGFLGAMRWLEILVIGIYAFQVSGSPFVVAIMLVARMLPMALFGTFIGALVENMDRRQVLIWTCVLMTLSALTGAIAAAINIMSLPLLAGVAFLNGLGWSTDFPVRRTLVGDVVEPKRLGHAMSLESATNSFTRMVGPLIGGAAYQVLGLGGAYAIAAVIYGLTIIFAFGVAPPRRMKNANNRGSLLTRLKAGFAYTRQNNVITSVLIITVILNLFGFAYATMIPVWAVENFNVNPVFVGLLASAEGGGAFLGSLTLAFWARPEHFRRLFLIGAVIFVAGLLIASKLTFYGVALLVLFVTGVGAAAFGAMQSTLILKESLPQYRSRIMGVLAACIGAGPLGVLNIGLIAELTSASTAIALSSALGLALIALVNWHLPTFWR